jgi:hypothetical protein
MKLAFYKAPGDKYDRAIRIWTGRYLLVPARYSHVELVAGAACPDGAWNCISASPRDGGVRWKRITFDPGKWDFLELPETRYPANLCGFVGQTVGAPYDWRGIWLSQFLRLRVHGQDAWFCSEWVIAALHTGGIHLPLSPLSSPQALFDAGRTAGWQFTAG